MFDRDAALEVISGYEQACSQEAGWIPMPMRNGNLNGNGAPGHDVSELANRLLCEENRLAVVAKLQWLQYAREELEALASGEARDEPARARRQAPPRPAVQARRAA